jgi:hypothetical protein
VALTARVFCSGGLATNSSKVNVRAGNGGAPHLTITAPGGGAYAILGDDVLSRTYHIQFVE